MSELLIARNPAEDSTLGLVMFLPLDFLCSPTFGGTRPPGVAMPRTVPECRWVVVAPASYPDRVTEMLIATLDGNLHPVDQPLLRADDAGVLRGDGVFETTLVIDGQPRDLPEHLARLVESARLIQLDLPDESAWRRGVDAVLGAWPADGDAEMALRLICTRGPDGARPTGFVTGAALADAIRKQRTGISVRVLDRGFTGSKIADAPWLLAGAKTLSYAINMAAQRYANSLGDDDVVFTGSDGMVLEGPTATVLLDEGGELITPPLEGILDGITVRRLFAAAQEAGWNVRREPVSPDRLLSADGAYLLSSARLLAPITAVDGVARELGPRTPDLAKLLQVPGA